MAGWMQASFGATSHKQESLHQGSASPAFPQNASFPSFSFSAHKATSLYPNLIQEPENAKMGDKEQKNNDELCLDEKLENAENAEKTRGSTTVLAADAAMTRRILLKLDFRYASALSILLSILNNFYVEERD
jgi:hypothetical protein